MIPRRRPRGFFSAFGYLWHGARLVYVEQRALAKYWVPPIVLTALAFGAVVYLALALHDRVALALWAPATGTGFFEQAAQLLQRVLSWLIALVLLGIGAMVVTMSASVIAAPFNDALSETVERLASGAAPRPFRLGRVFTDLRRTASLELRKWALYALVMGPLWFLSWLVPGPGSILSLVFGTAISALFFAVDYLDFSSARHDFDVGQRIAFVRRNLASVLGLGFGIWLLLFVPVVNLLFMPAAVAGSTLLFLDLRRNEAGVGTPSGVRQPST